MAGGLLEYSGLVTKTSAMRGKLLSGATMLALAEYENVDELLSFLRDSDGYAKIYRSHEEIQHRAQVEAVLSDSLYADYGKLYQFAGIEAKRGLEILFFRYEVNVLKGCLEHVRQGSANAKQGDFLYRLFDKYAAFETNAVMEAENMVQLKQALENSRYEKLFEQFVENEGLSFADCAVKLDIFYYQKAWQMCKKLRDKQMQKIIAGILGTEIDWQNIMWMYRSKQFFSLGPTEIYANLIPVSYRINSTAQKQLLEAAQITGFVETLQKTPYFTEKDAVVKLGDEVTFREVIDRTYRKICQKYPMSIAPVFAYLHQKEREIDNLTTVLEGVRYQVPAREIQELVLHV